ncbi:MAG: hypothetical protein U1E60_09025 [Reyranellaceae bacterium]
MPFIETTPDAATGCGQTCNIAEAAEHEPTCGQIECQDANSAATRGAQAGMDRADAAIGDDWKPRWNRRRASSGGIVRGDAMTQPVDQHGRHGHAEIATP